MCVKPSKTEQRTMRLMTVGASQVLAITDRNKTSFYRLEAIPSQIGGKGYQLSKAIAGDGKAESYEVLVAGQNSTCSCPWGTYGANKKPCRHVAALSALTARGQL